jgi:hypothetical protein
MSIRLFIIAYNNLTFVRAFVEQVMRITDHIVIVDNCSTYAKMHDYYDFLERVAPAKIKIHRLSENYGHTVYLQRTDLFPDDIYVLSDPDLLLNKEMPTDCCQQLLALSNQYKAYKVGLALDISDHDKFIKGACGETYYNMERAYWTERIESTDYELYRAPIDTTFCLINRNFAGGPEYRVAGRFLCKHLPWYEDYMQDNIPRAELREWMRKNKSSSILWHTDPLAVPEAPQIVAATYGTDKVQVNVLDKVQRFRQPTRLYIAKSENLNAILGDPAPRRLKKLVLQLKRPGTAGSGAADTTVVLPEQYGYLMESFTW